MAAPSLTPFTNGELQVYFYASQNFSAPTLTLPAPLIQQFNSSSVTPQEGFAVALAELPAPNGGTPSDLYNASSRYPASGATMGFPVVSGQAVLLIPSSAPPTVTATATPPPPPTATPTATPVMATRTPTQTPIPQTPTATATPSSPIAFVNAGPLFDSSSPVTTITVDVPSGVQANNELIAQILVYDGSGTNVPSAPAGWNLVRSDHIASGNQVTSWLYFRIASGSEPAAYAWHIASQYAAGEMGAWSGGSGGIEASSGATASGNPAVAAAPALTPAHNGDLQVYFYAAQNYTAPTIFEPAAITSRANNRSSKEGFTLAFGDLPAPFMGNPSPAYNATAAGSGSVVMSAQAVLLIPAP